MYSKRNQYNKFVYWIGPIGLFLIFVTAAIVIIILYSRSRKKTMMQNDRQKFKTLLYEYTEGSFQNYSDAMVDNYLSLYTFTNDLFPQSVLNSENSANNGTWNNDSEIFGSLCKILHNMLGISMKKSSKHYHSAEVWKVLDHAVQTISKKEPPWGQNWYQFAITYPLFLVSMTYFKEDVDPKEDIFLNRYLATYISKYFHPLADGIQDVYNYRRDGPNAVMMAVPYIGGHLLMNTYDPKDLSVTYARNYVDMKRVVTRDGIYDDFSFVFHTYLGPAYGYITSAMPDFRLISSFFDNKETMPKIYRILEKTEHPTINLHFGPWFNRASAMGGMSQYGKLGFYTMDHIRALSVKTTDFTIGYRGQQLDLCYYESDNANFSWAQYWISARRFLYKNTERNLQTKLIPYYSGCLSYGNLVVEMRSNKQTTETHMPDVGHCIMCQLPTGIAFLNIYKLRYSSFLFDVTELNLITSNGGHFYYNFKVDENTHASSPFTVGVNFGKLESSGSTTIGDMYKFEEAASFVYPGASGVVVKNTITHPTKSDLILDTVQIQPHLSNTTQMLECGFSTMHNDRNSNECIKTPTINTIETVDFIAHWPPSQPELLYLWDKKKKICAVSKEMSTIFQSVISIPSSKLQQTFQSSSYKIADSVTVNNEHTKTIPAGDKFQLLIKDVTLHT